MKISDDRELITKVCLMYYKQDLSQKGIAERMNLSRSTVSRILARAKELGLIEVTIKTDPSTRYLETELSLETALRIQAVKIVSSSPEDNGKVDELSKSSGQILGRFCKNGDHVGVGSGEILSKVAQCVYLPDVKDLLFVPMIGTINNIPAGWQASQIAEGLSKAFDGSSLAIQTPAVLEDSSIREYIKTEPNVSNILSQYSELKVAFFEINALNVPSSPLIESRYYTPEGLKQLEAQGAVGSINLEFFDGSGSGENFAQNEDIIGMGLAELKNVETTIGIARGKEAAKAVVAAAKGGLIKVLMTDADCATEILKIKGNQAKPVSLA